jgi:hypothetical protein
MLEKINDIWQKIDNNEAVSEHDIDELELEIKDTEFNQNATPDFCQHKQLNNLLQSQQDLTIADYYLTNDNYFSALQLYRKAFKRNPELIDFYISKYTFALKAYLE